MIASAAVRAGVAAGWWQLVVGQLVVGRPVVGQLVVGQLGGRSWNRASCSQREVDTESWGFVLQVEEAEDQGLRAGTEDPIPCVEVELGVGIDSEAVRSDRSPDGVAGAEVAGAEVGAAEVDAAALAAFAAVDQQALNIQRRQDSPPSR